MTGRTSLGGVSLPRRLSRSGVALSITRDDGHLSGSVRLGNSRFSFNRHDDHLGSSHYPLVHYGTYHHGAYSHTLYDHHRYGSYYAPYVRSYGLGGYYSHYTPIYQPYYYCAPRYGYTYSSVYYDVPYVAEIYRDDSYYAAPAPVARVDAAPATTSSGVVEYDTTVPASAVNASSGAVSVPAAYTTGGADVVVGEPAPDWGPVLGEGNAAFTMGRYDDARRLYVRAMLVDERDGYAKILYAWANFAIGDYELAATAIRRAVMTTPDLIEYPVDVRTLYADPLVFEGQLSQLAHYTTDHPDDREALLVLAYLHYSIGEAAAASTLLADAVGPADASDMVLSLLRDAATTAAKSLQH